MKKAEAGFRFTDPRDITIGAGRVIYAEALEYRGEHGPLRGQKLIEGWVLPGGTRTSNHAEAEAAAVAIDQAVQRHQNKQRKWARR